MGLPVKFHKVRKKLFRLPDGFGEGHPKRKIGFLLRHREDPRFLLPGVCIVDFPSWEAEYFLPYSKENSAIVSEFLSARLGIDEQKFFDAHSITALPDGSFLVSYQIGGIYFLRFDPDSEVCHVILPEDLGLSGVTELGATGFVSDSGEYCFLANVQSDDVREKKYGIFSVDIGSWSKAKLMFEDSTKSWVAPHMLAKVPWFPSRYLVSDFYYSLYRFESLGNPENVYNIVGLKQAFYRQIFRPYALACGISPSDESLLLCGTLTNKGFEPTGHFAAYVRGFFQKNDCLSFKEYADRSDLKFSTLPGEIRLVDEITKSVRSYETACANPAHFVFVPKNNRCYVSSHNFLNPQKELIEYFWPAAIDRFEILPDGTFHKTGTFQDPLGYRFTSHRVFKSPEGTDVVATIGGPNRLFFIDGDTMETKSCFDLHPNRLEDFSADPSEIKRYLQRDGKDPEKTFRGLEEIDSSWTLFSVSKYQAIVFSFLEKKVLSIGKVSESIPLPNGGNLADYHANSAHCDLLS